MTANNGARRTSRAAKPSSKMSENEEISKKGVSGDSKQLYNFVYAN